MCSGRFFVVSIGIILLASMCALGVMYVHAFGINSPRPAPSWLHRLVCMRVHNTSRKVTVLRELYVAHIICGPQCTVAPLINDTTSSTEALGCIIHEIRSLRHELGSVHRHEAYDDSWTTVTARLDIILLCFFTCITLVVTLWYTLTSGSDTHSRALQILTEWQQHIDNTPG